MTEETALELLSELQLVNDNMELIMDNLSPIILSAGLIVMLLSMLLGAAIVFVLTRAIGKGA